MPSQPYTKLECPVCHKLFTCTYPSKWAYQRNRRYYCSWKCIQAEPPKKGGRKKKAVEMAI